MDQWEAKRTLTKWWVLNRLLSGVPVASQTAACSPTQEILKGKHDSPGTFPINLLLSLTLIYFKYFVWGRTLLMTSASEIYPPSRGQCSKDDEEHVFWGWRYLFLKLTCSSPRVLCDDFTRCGGGDELHNTHQEMGKGKAVLSLCRSLRVYVCGICMWHTHTSSKLCFSASLLDSFPDAVLRAYSLFPHSLEAT